MVRVQKFFYFLIFSLVVAANVFAAPGRTTYQARIVKPDGYPLEANNVAFRFTILDPTGSCVIYVENYAAVNMANSGGLISFSLGSGVRSYPSSATTITSVFDNSTTSYSCQSPGIYTPVSTDNRKIVMQFNDGNGWQTLPAMAINAVPYAMYAGKSEDSILLNGKADSSFVEYSTIPTCGASQALNFNGATFSCITAGGGGGASYTVTSTDVTSALGYTPANPATLSSSFTTTASFSTVTAAVNSLTSSYTALAASVITSINGSTSSTQSFSLGIAGVAPTIQTSNGVHTFNLPLAASASVTAGLLSNADYQTFANKMNATSAAVIAALGYTPANNAASGTYLLKASNLSDLASATVARANLGLGNLATLNSLSSSDVTTALGYTPQASGSVVSSQWTTSGTTINYTAGNVGIGTTAPIGRLHISDDAATNIILDGYSNTTGAPGLATRKARGTSASPTAVLANDYLGTFGARGYGATGFSPATRGMIAIKASESWTDTAQGASIVFETTVNSGTTRTEKMRITDSGRVGVGVTSPEGLLHLAAGTSTVASLKLSSGTLLTSPQSGTIEYDGINYYVTDGNNIRRTIATASTSGSIDNTSAINSAGNLVLTPNNGAGSVIVSATTASTNSQTGALVVNGGLGVAGAANIGGNLNVSGTIHSSSYFSAASLMYLYGTGATYNNASDAYAGGERGFTADLGNNTAWDLLKLKNASGTQFVVEGGGYTGIGTADPDRRLTIIGDGTAYGDDVMLEATNNNSTGTYAQINLAKSRGTPASRTSVLAGDTLGAIAFRGQNSSTLGYGAIIRSIAEADYSSSQSADLRFQTTASGTTADRMIINSSGNVGIGLASPTARLHVAGNSAATAISLVSSTMILQNTNTTSGALNTIMFSNYDGFGNAAISTVQTNTGNVGNNLVLQTKTSGGGAWNADQLVLNSNGNVGIGVSAPSVKLHVGITDNNSVLFGANDGVNSNFRFLTKYTDGYNYIQAGVSSTDTTAKLKFSRAFGALNLADIRFLSDYASFNGNLGIGVTSAAAALDIANAGGETIIMRDNDSVNTDVNFSSYIRAKDASGTGVWYIGDGSGSANGTWLLNYQANPIHLATSSTTRMYISASGSIGVNTTAPDAMFDVVSGAIRSTRTGYNNVQYLEAYGGDATQTGLYLRGNSDEGNKKPLYLQTFHDGSGGAAGNLGFYFQLGAASAPTDVLTIRETGFVGIGTATPLEKLHVDASTSGRIAVASGNIFATSGYGMSLESDTDDGITYLNVHTGAFGANRGEFLIRGGHGASETASTRNIAMFETDTGNMGLGTINPTFGDANLTTNKWNVLAVAATPTTAGGAAALTLANQKTPLAAGDRVGAVHFVNTNNGTQLYSGFINVSLVGTGGANGYGGQMSFYTKGDNSLTTGQQMVIDQNGKVGLSTASPEFKLHIKDTTAPVIVFEEGDTTQKFYQGVDGAGFFIRQGTTANPDIMSIKNTGRVGIGVNNPGYQLELSTDSAAKPGTSTWTIASDRRLKDVRAPFTRGLAAIENIQPIYFNYKKDNALGLPSEKEYVGIIAQEIQKNIPEATAIDEKGFLHVTNDSIIWTMFNAIKELYHKWNTESQVLREKVSNLEEENKALKNYLCQKDPEAAFCRPKNQ